MRQVKQLLRELMTGLVIWCIPVLVILEFIARHKLAMAAGVLLGGLTAAVLLFHMYRHLDIALDMDTRHAQSHTQLAAMQRLGIMTVVLVAAMLGYRYVHPVGVVLGIFGMKTAALMQPLIHRYRMKRQHKTE